MPRKTKVAKCSPKLISKLEDLLRKLDTAISNKASVKRCLTLWSQFVRLRDGNRCIVCHRDQIKLAAHHVVRKCFLPEARFQTGNGITLCAGCHKIPHDEFNGKPDLQQPMDAEGGDDNDLICEYCDLLWQDASARQMLRDDFYFISDTVLQRYKLFQGFSPYAAVPGKSRIEQAYLIWRQSPRQLRDAILRANGFPSFGDYFFRPNEFAFNTGRTMKNRRRSAVYERCVAAWAIENFDFVDITITANAKIRGVISKRSRQVDVLLEDRSSENPGGRIIVEAKLHGRPVAIETVEAIESKLRDVNASHAVIVSSRGFTQAATRRSDELTELTLLDYDELVEEYAGEFSDCLSDRNCGEELLWSVPKIDPAGPGWLMYKYGKCLCCHAFHVHCHDCGAEFSIQDGQTLTCGCDDRMWGAIPESNISGHKGTPESTWLMLKINEEFYGLQRKPIGAVKSQRVRASMKRKHR